MRRAEESALHFIFLKAIFGRASKRWKRQRPYTNACKVSKSKLGVQKLKQKHVLWSCKQMVTEEKVSRRSPTKVQSYIFPDSTVEHQRYSDCERYLHFWRYQALPPTSTGTFAVFPFFTRCCFVTVFCSFFSVLSHRKMKWQLSDLNSSPWPSSLFVSSLLSSLSFLSLLLYQHNCLYNKVSNLQTTMFKLCYSRRKNKIRRWMMRGKT